LTITFDNEYTNTSGVTFVPCEDDVTVTFPKDVAIDYIAYLAVKLDSGDYVDHVTITPNADRTVWTYFRFENPYYEFYECESFCIVALVKHPIVQVKKLH